MRGSPCRLLAPNCSQLSEDELPGDLQSLSWLTSVDVPRLQQMASERMDFGASSQNAVLMHVPGAPGPMIHIQASLPQSVLGLNTVSSHGANVSMRPLPVPSLPALSLRGLMGPLPPSLSRFGMQCSPAAMYRSSYGGPPQYAPPRLAPHASQELQAKHYPKPIYSYSCLIAMALKNSKTGSLPVSEIYSFMKEHFPYFKTAPDGWKNSVRHNLSLNKCFEKVENKLSGTSRKGCLWALNPAKIDKMEEEMKKWKRKDLVAIHRSMANPDELDELIAGRPETCRRPSKQGGAAASSPGHVAAAQGRAPHLQPPLPPVMTLSLQPLPLRHQVRAQARMAPSSPAPAQTPPLHALHDTAHAPLPPHPMSRGPDFPGAMTEASAEVDALDPSLMDFALQGNLWEEIKDESFSLESLSAFCGSPLALSDCDLAPAGLGPAPSANGHSFSDLQVTGLYTTYTTLDSVSPTQYLGAQGNKPIALL
uniref:Forkhead box N4 n=1 Tax=Varanus komodoensis TaxID=61221 RepID=A0A8D2Q8I4_VARKO